MKIQGPIIYVPVGVGTFHMETAEQGFRDSCALLRQLAKETGMEDALVIPDGILFSTGEVKAFLKGKTPSLVILQNVTFANAAYTQEICDVTDAPVVVWTLRDPAGDGGRLKRNALTGAFAAANRLYMDGRISYRHILGDPSEESIGRSLAAYMRALSALRKVCGKTLLLVGEPPEGFSFGAAEETVLQESFGLAIRSVSAAAMIEKARAVTEAEAAPFLAEAQKQLRGFTSLPSVNQKGYAALMTAYMETAYACDAAALASRCWPDFFTEFGTPVCAVLSMLCDRGIPAACEGDAMGALTMLFASLLSGCAVFFGDPSNIDEKEGTLTFWHCGMAAPSLACSEEGPAVGVHCNRGIGPTMEFGCKGSREATILRFGKDRDGTLRLFTAKGEALERPRQYHGTSLVVKPARGAGGLIKWAVEDGWEPHFVIALGDIEEEMRLIALFSGISYWPY